MTDGGNFREVDLEVIGQVINGCDYGARPLVLARTQELLLCWIPGSSCRGSGYYQVWHPAQMRAIPRFEHGWRQLTSHRICEGERKHPRVFERCAAKIDALMGEGFHRLLSFTKTVVVGDNEPFSKWGHEMPITGREFGYEKFVEERDRRARLVAAGVTGIELEMQTLQGAGND